MAIPPTNRGGRSVEQPGAARDRYASRKSESESAWLLERVQRVPCLSKLTRRELGVVVDAFRRKCFSRGQRLYVQGKGTDYLYLIEDGFASVDVEAGFSGQRTLPAADGSCHLGDADVTKDARTGTATAATACTAWALDKLTLAEILKDTQHKKRLLYARAVARVPLFATLDKASSLKICDAAEARDYSTGELIVREAEPGGDFFVVLNGNVECTRYVAGANDSVCPTLKAGDFFGELAPKTGRPRNATCISLNDVEVLKIPKATFSALIASLGGLERDYAALEEQAMASSGDAEKRAAARRARRKARKGQGDEHGASPRAGDPVDPADMRSLGGVSFIATIPDVTPRSANKKFRGRMAQGMAGKVAVETGASIAASHIHVQGVKAGSLVVEVFLESATDEEAIAAALKAAGFGDEVVEGGRVNISNVQIHKRHIGKAMAAEAVKAREEASAQREIHEFRTNFLSAARQCFDLIDKDKGGTLSVDEIVLAVKNDQEVIKFLQTCGEDNLQFLLHPPRLQKALEILDTDKSGELDADEWEAAINRGLAKRLADLEKERERRNRAAREDDLQFSVDFLSNSRKVFRMARRAASGSRVVAPPPRPPRGSSRRRRRGRLVRAGSRRGRLVRATSRAPRVPPQIDVDDSGTLEKAEIIEAVQGNKKVINFLVNCGEANLQYLLVPARLEAALQHLDTDRDGHIDAQEWEDAIEEALTNKLEARAKKREEDAKAAQKEIEERATRAGASVGSSVAPPPPPP